MSGVVVQDMGLLVDRGVAGQGFWITSAYEISAMFKGWADAVAATSSVLAAANDAVVVPFIAGLTIPMKTAWWYNGATANGNVDVGLYDLDLNLLASTGAVAQSGTSAPQSATLTAAYTVLAGRGYYLAISSSSATGTFISVDAGAIASARVSGAARGTSSHPLPTTLTPAAMGSRYIPIFGLTYRTAGI